MKARISVHSFILKKLSGFTLHFLTAFCALTADDRKLISCFILQMDCALFCTCIGTYFLLMTNQTFLNKQGTVYFAGGVIKEVCTASLGRVSSQETDIPAFLLH